MNYDVLKSKSACFLLNKIPNFNKNIMGLKMDNTSDTFRQKNVHSSSYKNRELKMKLLWGEVRFY